MRLPRCKLAASICGTAVVLGAGMYASSAVAYTTPTGSNLLRIKQAFRRHAAAGVSYRIVYVHRHRRWVEVKVHNDSAGDGYGYMKRSPGRWVMQPVWNLDSADCRPIWRDVPNQVCRDFRGAR